MALTLAGEKRTKTCRGRCGEVKELREFSKRVDSPDGRNHYCLGCESARVRECERVKAAARTGAGGPAEPTGVSSETAA